MFKEKNSFLNQRVFVVFRALKRAGQVGFEPTTSHLADESSFHAKLLPHSLFFSSLVFKTFVWRQVFVG